MQCLGYLPLSVQLVHFSSDPVFFSDSKGFWPSSGILNTRKHNVLGKGKMEIQLDSFAETLCFLVFRIPKDG
jgi:hypothetical protein